MHSDIITKYVNGRSIKPRVNIAITIIKLIGGLAILIYGMNLLSTNLKKIAGEKFEEILRKATDNVFKGLFTGILITVAVQSSSATTVMVVGFVNAGILKLRNAIPIIMGANIGTTITAQILRLASLDENSIFALISPETLAPIFIVIGIVLLEMKKKQKTRDIGQLLIGMGLLFTGLIIMIDMASGFSELPILTNILTKLSNPILGVLAGALITALVQSSAAAVGILQAISTTGTATWASTIPVILGQNIGTCLTSILASIGTSKNSKRAAAVHLYFNIIGTVIFMIIIYVYQNVVGFSFWNNTIDMGGIANFHLIFNIASTIILLPCIGILERLTMWTIRDNKNITDDDDEDNNDYLAVLNTLDMRIARIPSIAIGNSLKVIIKQGEASEKNLHKSIKLISEFDTKRLEHIQEREDAIDKMDMTVTNFLVNIGSLDITEQDNKNIVNLLRISSEFEKVGDYSYKLAKIIEHMKEKNLKFSQVADKEIRIIHNTAEEVVVKTLEIIKENKVDNIIEIEALKEISENYREKYKIRHIERLKQGMCLVETGMVFMEALVIYEKIIDHCLNIAISGINYVTSTEYVTKREYLDKIFIKNNGVLELKKEEISKRYTLLAKDNKLI